MNVREIVDFYRLVIASLEGDISDDDFQHMMKMIEADSEVAFFYCELIRIHTNLCCPKLADSIFNAGDTEISKAYNNLINGRSDTWLALLDTEIHAPVIPAEKDGSDIIDSNTELPVSRRIKFSLYAFTFAAAMMILISIFLQLNSKPSSSYMPPSNISAQYVQVASLVDGIGVRFEDSFITVENSYEFSTNSMPIKLLEGMAVIQFKNGVIINLEGPAEIAFTSKNSCELGYGNLYAIVPESGYGFTVRAGGNEIVDLGTEFGVQAKLNGDTELHVIKGKTTIANPHNKEMLVCEGQARVASAKTGKINEVKLSQRKFVRKVSAKDSFIWRGEDFSLASLVAGGDGFDMLTSLRGIDPADGSINEILEQDYLRSSDKRYHRFIASEFIDGVFVPNGNEPVTVSSTGHKYSGFPSTDSYYWSDISASDQIKMETDVEGEFEMVDAMIDGMKIADAVENSLILIHSNAGITFDLQKIRDNYPQFNIKGFRSLCGVSSNAKFLNQSEFWVLVDGKLKYHHQTDSENYQSQNVKVEITDNDRYLTLAVTDGGDKITFDWCIFAHPYLILDAVD